MDDEQILTSAPPTDSRFAEDLQFREVIAVLWSRRWFVISMTILFAAMAVVYSFVAEKWYRAEVVVIPAQQRSVDGLMTRFGALADLTGISVGSPSVVEPLAVLQSREFTRNFVVDLNLMPVIFSDQWDKENNIWEGDDKTKWPDEMDAVGLFDKELRRVAEDINTGVVTLTIDWKEPGVAADWANDLIKRLNSRMRQRALEEASRNIAYLQSQMTATDVVTLQQALGKLLEGEMQKLMLAKGNEEFSFRVVDRAVAPKDPVWPRPALLIAIAAVIGGLFSTSFVYVQFRLRSDFRG